MLLRTLEALFCGCLALFLIRLVGSFTWGIWIASREVTKLQQTSMDMPQSGVRWIRLSIGGITFRGWQVIVALVTLSVAAVILLWVSFALIFHGRVA